MATSPTSWWSKDTIAVVTGANTGIGYEIVRALAEHGLTVVLTARDATRGQAAVDSLKSKGLNSIVFHTLDIRSQESVNSLAAWLKKEFGGIDILVNNAAIGATSYSFEVAEDLVDTNYRGTKAVTEALLPLLRSSPAGARIVNLTTRLALYERLTSDSLKQKFRDEGKYSEEYLESLVTTFLDDVKAGGPEKDRWVPNIEGKTPLYSESKIFLNVYSIVLAKSLSKSQRDDHQIFVASTCPGVTKTATLQHAIDTGLFKVPDGFPFKTPSEGADTSVWLALLPKEEWAEKTGKFFGERAEYSFGWVDPPF